MCCPGCQAVAQAIIRNGLGDFYTYRTEKGRNPQEILSHTLEALDLYDKPELQKGFVVVDDESVRHASLILEGIVCAACVWLNERHVGALPGVIEFRINYSTRRASVKWDDSKIHLSDILRAIAAIGYVAHPFDPSRQEQVQKRERSRALRGVAVAGLGMMQVMMLAVAMYAGDYQGMDLELRDFMRWVSLVIATPVVLYAAAPFFRAAWRDLRRLQLGMDVPVSLAIGGAFAASVWATIFRHGEVYYDSVSMFTFFLLTGRYLEMMARHKAGQAAEELIRLLPATTTRVVDGQDQVISAAELVIGDCVRVRPGETIPADGVVLNGASSVDESLLTGESMPVSKAPQATVIGGSVNIESPLLIRVEKLGEDTVLSAIVRLLDRAQTEKPRLAFVADRVAAWFVGALLLFAVIVAWYWIKHDPEHAFRITLSVLVVTCPCALSLATPAALVAATGRLTRTGLLTTRGHALETLARVNHFIFDKTGTLTEGRLHLEEVICLQGQDEKEMLNLAAALEQGSEHPVAQALLTAATAARKAQDVQSIPGQGMEGEISGQMYRLGNLEFVTALSGTTVDYDILPPGSSTVALGNAQGVLALFTLRDQLRQQGLDMIDALRRRGMHISLLSGDHVNAVQFVADRLGIEDAHAGMLPQNKLDYIRYLQEQGRIVAMVGDGVNDAPVLAAAQVSIAMGGGTQIAHASADMVLLSEHLPHLVVGVDVARKTLAIIRQNLAWALIYNALALPLAALGMIAPWMAAIGMSVSSLVVVLNALRLTVTGANERDILPHKPAQAV